MHPETAVSCPDAVISLPPRNRGQMFFRIKTLRRLRPQREWSLPTLRLLRGSPSSRRSLRGSVNGHCRHCDSGSREITAATEAILAQREGSLPPLRLSV